MIYNTTILSRQSSTTTSINASVPLGYVLGPWLFSVFTGYLVISIQRKELCVIARINNRPDWNETYRPYITGVRRLLTAVIYKMHVTSWPPDLKKMLLSCTWSDMQLAPAMLCHITHVNQSKEPTPLARTSPMHLWQTPSCVVEEICDIGHQSFRFRRHYDLPSKLWLIKRASWLLWTTD